MPRSIIVEHYLSFRWKAIRHPLSECPELAQWADASALKPNDGEIVLVFNGHDRVDREGEPAFDLDTYWEGLGWGNSFDGFRCKQDEPTHWMRIPAPPPRSR